MQRIVLLSFPGPFAVDVLSAMRARGARADALLLYDPVRPVRGGAAARLAAAARMPIRRARRRLLVLREGAYSRAASELVLTGALNGRRMARDLARLRPDVVVLARCGLLAPEVVGVPPGGVVAVHPGLLPWVRGVAPLGNALLRGVPLGSTIFRVDAGIDTGRILHRRLLPVAGGESPEALRRALSRQWAEMTAELVGWARAGDLPEGRAQEDRHPLCRALDPAADARVGRAVAAGWPRDLYERWARLAPDGVTLPLDADPPCTPYAPDDAR
jgi:methionyl-tRNA formyltransferase